MMLERSTNVKTNNHRIYLVAAIVIISLGCVTTPGEAPPWEAVDEELQDLNRNACDGTPSLAITSAITNQETNQYGTRMCEYTLTIKNTKGDIGIWVYFYQHDKDGYAHTEKSHWMGNILIESGKEENWSGHIYIYDDKDADGPVMSIPEKIAGVYDIPECAEEKRNENFFELISIPLEMVFPIE